MAHRVHAPYSTDMYQRDFEHDDLDDVESMRRVPSGRDHMRRLSNSSSGTSDHHDYAFPAEPSDPRLSVLGPKLTRVSDAPWEGADPLLEDDEDLDNGLDALSLFGANKRGRAIDWKRPFAQQQQPRSSSSSRPSRDLNGPSKDKGGLGIYGNSYASRSAASLSVYSVTSGKDVFAASDAPPLPVHLAPMPASRKGARTRTTSAGASVRSSVFSAVSSRSHNSSSGNEVPPMPFPRGFDHVESPHGSSHPYANPDLVESKSSLSRTDTINSTQDDGMSLLAPSLSHTSATRSPRSPRSPLGANGNPTSLISTPMPAAPNALHGLAMNAAWANGGTNGASYALISLEQAQAQQRAKSAAASSPATAVFPVSTLPFDPAFAERERQRKISTASSASYMPAEPMEHGSGSSYGPPAGKSVKPRRSGFMKLLRGGSKDKDFSVVSPTDQAPAVPPLPAGPSRPVITHPHPQRFNSLDSSATSDRRLPPSPSDSDSPGAPPPTVHSVNASPATIPGGRKAAPPALSLVVTPSSSPNHPPPQGRPSAPLRGLTLDVASSFSVHPETPPRSAPPGVRNFDAPLQLRPMSTLFSGLPRDMFNGSPASPVNGHDQKHQPLMASVLAPTPDEVEGWRSTISSLEQEVRELRAQMAEMREMAGSMVCEHCGSHLAHAHSAQSFVSMSVIDSSVGMGTSSSMSSVDTYAGSAASQQSFAHLQVHSSKSDGSRSPYDDSPLDLERTPPAENWKAQGISVVDRPRARLAGRDRTTFAGMWRD